MPKKMVKKAARSTAPGVSADLTGRIERLLNAARREGREEALAEVRSLVGGTAASSTAAPKTAGASAATQSAESTKPAKAPRKKSSKSRKNPWATMTAEQKAERVRKMLAGRGIKPKS